MARYDDTGAIQWVRSGGGSELVRAYDVAVSPSGIVYATGQFFGVVTFGIVGRSSLGGFDVFLWGVQTDGTFAGFATGGGPLDDTGWGVAVDASNNVLVAGEFRMAMQFGGPGSGNNAVSSHGENDAFLVKISPGPVYEWTVSGGGPDLDAAYSVTTGGTKVYLGGTYSGVARFQNNTMTSLGGWDAFVASYECDYALPVRTTEAHTVSLQQNIPNPFGVETAITFRVATGTRVQLDVFDVAGRLVRALVDDTASPDLDYVITWDGHASDGSLARSGVYFYRLTTSAGSQTRKMVVTR
jgi:hypothetical protein